MRTIEAQREELVRPDLYIILIILMLMMTAGAGHLSWRSSPEIHTNLGVIAVVLALAMGLGALVRFFARRNAKFLFIGAGFLGAVVLDGLHTAIGTGRLLPLAAAPNILPASWNTSQLFLGAMLLTAADVGEPEQGPAFERHRLGARLGVAAGVLVCCVVFIFAPLTPALAVFAASDGVVGAGASVLLLAALWKILRKRDWSTDRFEYWLAAALFLFCGSQLISMAKPEPLFSAILDTAHVLKISAYGLVLTGVLSNGYQLFLQTDQQVEALAQLNEKLRLEISHREAAEAALRASEERFSLAVQGSDEGLWDWPDTSKPAQWWSPRFYTLLGYEPDEVAPSRITFLRHLLHPEDYERTRTAMKTHLDGGESFDIEYRLRTKRGETRWFRSRAKTFRLEGPGPVRMVGTIIDIHPRKLAEAKIQAQADELGLANEELEQFAYAASHDLQEPLRNLVAYCGILRGDLGSDMSKDAATDLHYIEDAARRMKALVEDLLALSRAGRAALSRAPVELEECVRRSLANLQQQLLESEARVRWEQLPTVLGDPTMLTQLYQNLISNALKFRGDVPPEVALTAQARDEHWILGVRDNGIGLEPAYSERIFGPFQRLHGMSEYEGNGIGLAICRKTVERHGGTIWVESEPGRGAHFKFTLPAATAKLESCQKRQADAPRTSHEHNAHDENGGRDARVNDGRLVGLRARPSPAQLPSAPV